MVTAGQSRCARCCMVVFDVFTQILQDLMKECGVPSEVVYQKIMNNKNFRQRLNPTEMQKVQTLKTDGFSQLDVSLIYKIVKYFKIFIPSPTRQWGSNPQQGEIEVGDDVERIRIARNTLLHNIKGEVSIGDMNDFFTTFIDVGRRMDQHLDKPEDSGYEQSVRNYRLLDMDDDMTEQNVQALHEKESFKEKCAVKIEDKEIRIYIGREMYDAINRVRHSDADATTPVKFIIDGVDDSDQQIEMLNSLQGEINTASGNIVFKKATKECIALYCLVKNKVLLEEEVFQMEVCRFIKHILEVLNVGSSEKGNIYVVMTSAEDDSEIYNSPICSPVEADPRGIWSGNNSLVLNIEIKREVFATSDTLQKYMSEFFGTILKKTNGRQLIKKNDVNIIIEKGDDHDIDMTEENVDTREEEKVYVPPSYDVGDTSYSELEYAKAQSPGSPNTEDGDSLEGYAMAQVPVLSPGDRELANIPPKFRQLKRKQDKEEVVKPWQYYFGFRRLLELKEKDATEIIHIFHTRKLYLIDALNDTEMHNNKEIIIFLLHCFAKCCEYEVMLDKVSDVFEILQYSSFLKVSVVRFIDGIAIVSKLQRETYYQKSMKDLLVVLNEIKSVKSVYKECIGPIVAVLEKREDFFKDSEIFDERIRQEIQELKDFTSQIGLKTDYSDEMGRLKISVESKSTEILGEKKMRSPYDRQQNRRSGIETEKRRPTLGFKKLVKLKDSGDEEILRTFIGNIGALKEALNDEHLPKNKDMVSLFLHCLAKSSRCDDPLNDLQVRVFEILNESIFLQKHVVTFVEGIAAGTLVTTRIIPTKQSLKDIFCIFDAFNSLIPTSVSHIHDILTSMDTSINIIYANQRGSEFMDEDLWHTFHTLMDRRTATSPEKRQ